MHKGYTVDQIHDLTKIDKWFLEKLKHIIDIDEAMKKCNINTIGQGAPLWLVDAVVGQHLRELGTVLSVIDVLGSSYIPTEELLYKEEESMKPNVECGASGGGKSFFGWAEKPAGGYHKAYEPDFGGA